MDRRSETCRNCPYLSQYTESKEFMKRISRHIWADYLEEAVHLRRTERNKKIYSQRKETIERVFADMKEKHGMWWTTLRGLRKVSMQAMLVFACMNLKKLATWLWRSGGSKHNFTTLCLYIVLKIRQTPEFYSEQRSLSAIWETPLRLLVYC